MSGDLAELFSRKMRVGGLALPPERQIAATAAECANLAAAFGLPAIAALAGDFTFPTAKSRGGIIEAGLALRATVTQLCVVSLEPFESVVTETARLRFVPAASLREDADVAELTPETLEGPDEVPYTGDEIDLGGTLAEQLALALDPYPRKPGAALPAGVADSAANPFAALAARRGRPANDPE